MNKYFKSLGLLALSAFFLASCSSIAHVEKDPSVNLEQYKTFAWVDTRSQNDTAKARVSDLTERRIQDAVNAELAKAGYRESKTRPDVLLAYDLDFENSVREQNNAVYSQPFTRYYYNPYWRRWTPVYYPSQFLGYDVDQRAVREGTVTIRLIDAQTDKTVWQGWTTDEVNSRNLTSKEIASAVRSIFRKFDVASR